MNSTRLKGRRQLEQSIGRCYVRFGFTCELIRRLQVSLKELEEDFYLAEATHGDRVHQLRLNIAKSLDELIKSNNGDSPNNYRSKQTEDLREDAGENNDPSEEPKRRVRFDFSENKEPVPESDDPNRQPRIKRRRRSDKVQNRAKNSATLYSDETKSLATFGQNLLKLYETYDSRGEKIILVDESTVREFSAIICYLKTERNEPLKVDLPNVRQIVYTSASLSRGEANKRIESLNQNSDATPVANDENQSVVFSMELDSEEQAVEAIEPPTVRPKARVNLPNIQHLTTHRADKLNERLSYQRSDEKLGLYKISSTNSTNEETLTSSIICHLVENHLKPKSFDFSQLFRSYLTVASHANQNILPPEFMKIYTIYRRLNPLPTQINSSGFKLFGLKHEELWFTLTANEISFKHDECDFLLRAMQHLHFTVDDDFEELIVRLLVLLGLKTHIGHLEKAYEVIKECVKVDVTNRRYITKEGIKHYLEQAQVNSPSLY